VLSDFIWKFEIKYFPKDLILFERFNKLNQTSNFRIQWIGFNLYQDNHFSGSDNLIYRRMTESSKC